MLTVVGLNVEYVKMAAFVEKDGLRFNSDFGDWTIRHASRHKPRRLQVTKEDHLRSRRPVLSNNRPQILKPTHRSFTSYSPDYQFRDLCPVEGGRPSSSIMH